MDTRRARLYLGYRALGCSERQARKNAGFKFRPFVRKCGCGAWIHIYSKTGRCSRCAAKPQRKTQRNAEIILEYETGKNLREVSELFGITRERVRQVLRRSGVHRMSADVRRHKRGALTAVEKRRWRGNYRKQERLLLRRKAERLYLGGMMMREVGESLGGLNVPAVSRLVRVSHRPCGTYDRRKAGAWVSEMRRWDRILDGRMHEIPLAQGSVAHTTAAHRGKRVMTFKVDDTTAVVLAYQV